MSFLAGIDIGFAALGWATWVELPSAIFGDRALKIEASPKSSYDHSLAYQQVTDRAAYACGVIKTKKESKRRQLHTSSDDARRIDTLTDGLHDVLLRHKKLTAIGYEIPGGAQSARAAMALGLAHALTRSTITQLCPAGSVREFTARDVKKAWTGKVNASKDEMIATANERHPGLLEQLNKGEREHAADALAILAMMIELQTKKDGTR